MGDGKFSSVEVMVRCAEAYNASGSMKLSPVLKRPAAATSDGILGCLQLAESGLRYLTENEGEWSFLLLVSDGVSSNRAAVRKTMASVELCLDS